MESKLDLFGNALLELENLVPDFDWLSPEGEELPPPSITLSTLYFCIPQNDRLLEYWDTVADRLFKIRHCQNIEGVERILALFAPPIDPGALVRAAAAGLDISEVIKGLNAPLPFYRFNVMAQKALELVQEVRTLGTTLLQTLEKKDAEALGLLRSSLELHMQNAIKAVKEQHLEEAKMQIEALKKSQEVTRERIDYYKSREFMNAGETAGFALTTAALVSQTVAMALDIVAGVAHLFPDLNIGASGFGGTPHATAKYGGVNIGNSSTSWADVARALAGILQTSAGMASSMGGYRRRKDDWDFQATLAEKELNQMEKQQLAAEIRAQLAEKELENHELQIENTRKTDEFMRSKFTNQELYDWMIGQISAVYFKAYQLAFDTAKKAERCFQHELGTTSSFLRPGYWDSLKKGLQAADHLFHDIKRMEIAYLEQNKREYELSKHISLALLDPMALIRLKSTGKCTIHIPEAWFDLDHPGHYLRRLKSVSISIPCVVGPYTSVSCKLSLVSNKYRKTTAFKAGAATDKDRYSESTGNDERFVYNIGTLQSIATSHARDDSGVFELSFRDERYLPFEGAGAISTWQLELPTVFKQFDYSTISDIIIHLKYTARDGGSGFKAVVEGALQELLDEMILDASTTGLSIAYNLRHEFPNQWHIFKQDGSVSLNIGIDRLPFYVKDHTPTITATTWIARIQGNPATFDISLDGTAVQLKRDTTLNNLCKEVSTPISLSTEFTLSATDTTGLEDMVLLINYRLE